MGFELLKDSLSETIFLEKYAAPGETSWKELAKRVARTGATSESAQVKENMEKKFYEAINSGDFCPGGRILFGSGRSKQNLLNCYVLAPEDSVESIGKTISDM